MKQKLKKILLPGAMLGAFLVTGATASAFSSGNFSLDAFSSFTDEQQAAIEEAHNVMEDAKDEADSILENAGVDREGMQEARREYGEGKHQEVEQALEDGDYNGFAELVADTPLGKNLNEELFNKLVEMHKLRTAGDHEAARELAESMKADYDFGPGLMMGDRDGSKESGHRSGFRTGNNNQ